MPEADPKLIAAERELLRQIWGGITPSTWARIQRELQNYAWRGSDHQVIFEALRRLPSRSPDLLRERLLQELTRMGFPDIDVNQYSSHLISQQTRKNENESQRVVIALLAQLKAADPE